MRASSARSIASGIQFVPRTKKRLPLTVKVRDLSGLFWSEVISRMPKRDRIVSLSA
jgi:hypothetical protein